MKPLPFLLFFLIFFSCKNEPTDSSSTKQPTKTEIQKPQPVTLVVHLDNLRLRDAAGEKANEIVRLPKNTKLTYNGELSEFTTKIKLRGMQYDESWLKVTTSTGQAGWVYAGGIKPATTDASEYLSILEEMRLQSFFGKNLSQKIKNANNALTKKSDSASFAKAYENSMNIRDEIIEVLEEKISIDDPQQLPDMSWLENAMQGFTTSLVAEGTMFYLFADYIQLNKMAQQTSGNEDDDFTQLQFSIFPLDSIEHFYPVWFLQTWDYGGHSLLGEGHHFNTLKKVNELLEKKSPFKISLENIKKEIMDDITDTDKYVTYWYKKEKILSEIDQIIEANFVSLTPEENIALTARRKMFTQPNANAIKVDQRSGE